MRGRLGNIRDDFTISGLTFGLRFLREGKLVTRFKPPLDNRSATARTGGISTKSLTPGLRTPRTGVSGSSVAAVSGQPGLAKKPRSCPEKIQSRRPRMPAARISAGEGVADTGLLALWSSSHTIGRATPIARPELIAFVTTATSTPTKIPFCRARIRHYARRRTPGLTCS